MRQELVDPSDPARKALILPWQFERAAQFLTSHKAPLKGNRDNDYCKLVEVYGPALRKAGYKPEAVMSDPVQDLVGLDAAFARWRNLPTPLGPVDRLLDKAVNDLVALRKSEFASAAARLQGAAKALAFEVASPNAGLHDAAAMWAHDVWRTTAQPSCAVEPKGDVRFPRGSSSQEILFAIADRRREPVMTEYRKASENSDEAKNRLDDLSRLLEGQIKTGRVDPWALMREVPGLRPVLQQVLPAPVPWSR